MMKSIFVLFLFISVFLYGGEPSSKYLKSETRAEVYAQNLIEGGYNEKANKFLDLAIKKYSNNPALLMFKGTVLFNKKNLEESKKYFMLVLEKDPTNEQASEFINLIEEQESAKENKVIKAVFQYLSDKGLDFLMMFLAFLGGEIIARRYTKCNIDSKDKIIEKFHIRKQLSSNLSKKVSFTLKYCCFSKRIFSFCFILETLVTVIIVFALLIVWLMLEFTLKITIFFDEPLVTLSSNEIWQHSFYSFVVLTVIMMILRLWMNVSDFDNEEENYRIEMAEEIQKIYTNREYQRLYPMLKELSVQDIEDIQEYIQDEELLLLIREKN